MKKLLIFISVGLIATLAISAELQSFFKSQFSGLNNSVNVRLLQDNEAYDLSNFSLDEIGSIKERDLFGQYNSSSGQLGSNSITGLFKYYTATSKSFIACAGSNVALGSAGAFSTSITPTTNTVTSGTYWSGCTFKEFEYLFNPSVPMMKYGAGFNGGTNLHPPPSYPDTNCAYGTPHKSRVWAARSDSLPYRIYFSSLNNGDNWTTTGGYIDLPDTTQTITGIISWGGYLYIFTETNIYVLLGSTPNDFSLRKTNSMVGAIAPRSIKVTDIGVCFVSRSGVYAFDGNNSNKISTKIDTTISGISKTLIQNACAIYDGKKYWLAYTLQGSSYNNRVIIYDILLKDWTIYQGDACNISYFERAYGGTDKGELYGGSSIPNGIVYQLQASTGTESITHETKSDFLTGTTTNTVIQATPLVNLQHGSFVDGLTKLLIHFNGTDAATTYTTEDSGLRTVTFAGDAVLDDSQYKFGTTSLQLNGVSGTYASVPSSADWNFGTSDFTIDFWVRFNSTAAQDFMGQYVSGSDFWTMSLNGTKKLTLYWINGGTEKADFSSTSALNITTGTWYHIALVRNGSTCYMFLDGVSQAVTQNVGFGNLVYVAGDDLNFGKSMLQGWSNLRMDEIRISNGIARWTANFTPPNTEYYASRSGTLTSKNIQINAAGASALSTISWISSEPANTKLTFQTRTGATDDTVYFNGWQTWTSSNTVSCDTVTSGTVAFTSSDNSLFKVLNPSSPQTRNILNYESDDSPSPSCVQFQTFGASSTNKYADETIPAVNLSNISWLSGWIKSPQTGNSVELWIGESSAEQVVSINTVTANTWEKWYWYIGDITSSSRNDIKHLRVKYTGDTAGNVFYGGFHAHDFYTSGDIMASTPNDWIQYRAIFGSNDDDMAPLLTSLTLTYTPELSVSESSLSSYYYTKWFDFKSPQINKQFDSMALECNTTTASTVSPYPCTIYCDYDIDAGVRTGTLTFTPQTTANTVRMFKNFPSNLSGKTMRLKFYNTDKDAQVTIKACEIRYRAETTQPN